MERTLRFLMFGGFLGAGKTTAIRKFVQWLSSAKGLRSAVITNDQASELVDSALMKQSDIPTEEIAGGCFCCRSDLLMQSAEKLINDVDPDVLIGEPVGSCTDLVSTVSLPLQEIFQAPFEVGPLSVLVDPLRAQRFLKRVAAGTVDASDIDYIYQKQLEEAQIIVINKRDLLPAAALENVEQALAERYPRAAIFSVSARHGHGLQEWWEFLDQAEGAGRAGMEVDYQRYGDAEARMGWLNGALHFAAEAEMDPNEIARSVAEGIAAGLQNESLAIAHLKVLARPDEAAETAAPEQAVVQWVDEDLRPEFTSKTTTGSRAIALTINLRAEAGPDRLRAIVEHCFEELLKNRQLIRKTLTAFAPSAPKPVHRVLQ